MNQTSQILSTQQTPAASQRHRQYNRQRNSGFDVARALAIFGMVIVNFKIAMNAESGTALGLWFASLFEGRASALFVMLAGIGITFLTRQARASNNPEEIRVKRMSLIKRGLLLIVLGLAYIPVWEADILHFYGVYFLLATAVFMVSGRFLLRLTMALIMAFPVMMLVFDYDQNWHWPTFSYQNFWTLDGMIRHLFFNGFHPFFPWAGFLVLGMWLGRQELNDTAVQRRLFVSALVVFLVVESVFYGLRLIAPAELQPVLSISIIPPLPQYMISAASTAVMILLACLVLTTRFPNARIIQWLASTGQLALTLYVAHVLLGMGTLEAIGQLYNQTIEFALFSAAVFSVSGIAFSVIWLRYFRQGPLEWLFRYLSR
ncbi:DUF418 domain-containing protein [Bacterioplanoides sp.]|uniref:DUF418 domain-containing protein n=1 Tax=Bacterioplanoides sp. TaxID=2066072 RepID=UPI003B00E6D4